MKIKLLTSFLFLIFVSTSLLAARPSINDLNTRVNVLEAENTAQQAQIDSLQSDVGTLQIEVDALELAAASGLKVKRGEFTSTNISGYTVSTGVTDGTRALYYYIHSTSGQFVFWSYDDTTHLRQGASTTTNQPNWFDNPTVTSFVVGASGVNGSTTSTVTWLLLYD